MSTKLCRFWFLVHHIINDQRQRRRHEAIIVIVAADLERTSHVKRVACFTLLGVKEELLVPFSVLSLTMSTAGSTLSQKKYDRG